MKNLINNNKELSRIINNISDSNFNVYIVGGAVRDFLLGLNPHDFDLATNATPDDLAKIFETEDLKFVGESFGVTLINGFEIATLRKDIHTGIGDKNCEVLYTDNILDDLCRRDFTINAIAYNPISEEFIDAHGGITDLENKIIRFVNAPYERILQDPNRIIRAARFAARLEFDIEPNSREALKSCARLIEGYVAPERIRLEIFKALGNKNTSDFFGYLLIIDALRYILPSLDECYHKGHDHGIHHIETIWEHSMIAGDAIQSRYPLLKLAGYLHDVGKPVVQSEEGTFYNHEAESEKLIQNDLLRLKFSTNDIKKVSAIARCHMYSLSNKTSRAARRVNKKLYDRGVSHDEFIRIHIADRKGNIKRNEFTLNEIVKYIKTLSSTDVVNTPNSVKNLCIDGNFIMQEFNLNPSKRVGEILNFLLEFVVDNGFQYNRPEVLVGLAHNFLQGE